MLGALALIVMLTADGLLRPAALPWVLAGLGLRAWSFHWLGPAGRTRRPGPPPARSVGGPYSVLGHPVYVANLLLAAGLVVAVVRSGAVAALFLGAVTALYAALAAREEPLLRGLPERREPALSARGVARSERSTWITTALVLLIAWLQ